MAAIEVNVSALLAQLVDQRGYIRPCQKSIPSISGSSIRSRAVPSSVRERRSTAVSEYSATCVPTQEGVMTDKKRRVAFRTGSSNACESLLYEFTSHYGSGTSEEAIVERIAAARIKEGLVYLRRWRPDLEVM